MRYGQGCITNRKGFSGLVFDKVSGVFLSQHKFWKSLYLPKIELIQPAQTDVLGPDLLLFHPVVVEMLIMTHST